MNTCGLSEGLLQAYYDEEAGADTQRIGAHISSCASCATQLRIWRQNSDRLRTVVDDGIGSVEPLLALRDIRARIAKNEERRWSSRIATAFSTRWQVQRRTLLTATLAGAVGVLTVPGILWWLSTAEPQRGSISTAAYVRDSSIVVESLEYRDDANGAVVYKSTNGLATLIWLAPGEGSNRHGAQTIQKF